VNLTWDFPAQTTWKQLDPADAHVVARAAYRLAEAGEGDLQWEPPYYRLRAGRFDLALALDRRTETICVLHIYRARR
jgi:hypothetical protein